MNGETVPHQLPAPPPLLMTSQTLDRCHFRLSPSFFLSFFLSIPCQNKQTLTSITYPLINNQSTFFKYLHLHNYHKLSNHQHKLPSPCLILGDLPLRPSICLSLLNHLTDTNLISRRKDFGDKAEETLKPDSQKSLFDKTKEGVTDAGKSHLYTSLLNILLTTVR